MEGNYRFLAIFTIFKQFGRGRTCATFKNIDTKLFFYTIKPITNIKKLHSNLGVASRVQNLKIKFLNYPMPEFRPISSIIERYSSRDAQYFKIVGPQFAVFKKFVL